MVHVKAISTLNSHNYNLQCAAFIYLQFLFLFCGRLHKLWLSIKCRFVVPPYCNCQSALVSVSLCICVSVVSRYLAFIVFINLQLQSTVSPSANHQCQEAIRGILLLSCAFVNWFNLTARFIISISTLSFCVNIVKCVQQSATIRWSCCKLQEISEFLFCDAFQSNFYNQEQGTYFWDKLKNYVGG